MSSHSRYKVKSATLAGYAPGDVVDGDELADKGANVAALVTAGHLETIGDAPSETEPDQADKAEPQSDEEAK